jgi:hypothetical protein
MIYNLLHTKETTFKKTWREFQLVSNMFAEPSIRTSDSGKPPESETTPPEPPQDECQILVYF